MKNNEQNNVMNRDAYNEAWCRLLTARRLGSLEEIQECAEKLAHEARALSLELLEPADLCDHKYTISGYCLACGQHPVSRIL